MFGVVVTGPPGAGKTASLIALSDGLIRDEIAHAAIDLDELVWAYPYPTFEQRCEQLRAWSVLQRRAGHTLFLLAEAGELAGQPRLEGVHVVLDTEPLSPTEVAEHIRAAIPPGQKR